MGFIVNKKNNFEEEIHQAEKENDYGPSSLSITFDSKTGKAKEVGLPFFSFCFLFHDAINSRILGETFGFSTEIKSEDGIHEMGGSGTQVMGSVTYEEKWNIKRYRNK